MSPKPSKWLIAQAKLKGITVDEVRAEMARRSAQANKKNSGFAIMDKERHSEVSRKGGSVKPTEKYRPEFL